MCRLRKLPAHSSRPLVEPLDSLRWAVNFSPRLGRPSSKKCRTPAQECFWTSSSTISRTLSAEQLSPHARLESICGQSIFPADERCVRLPLLDAAFQRY